MPGRESSRWAVSPPSIPARELILRTVEREQSAAYTASHLAAMTVMAQVATVLGEGRGASGVAGFRAALDRLPDEIADCPGS